MEEPADGHDENMHSSSQVAVAAVDLSSTEGSEVDILDVSIQNMSIYDSPTEDNKPEALMPCASSTPKKSKKHQIKKFVESPGKTTSRVDVMEALETDNKRLATRAVKEAFSSVKVDHRKENIDILYEKELQFLLQHDKKLSASEQGPLVDEFQKLSNIVNLGVRSGESIAEVQINSSVFQNLQLNIKKDCPILTGIIEVLFLCDNSDRKERKERGNTCTCTSCQPKEQTM
ncbi:Hypothetical predicted protein [Paramuricea clavata]|uniref:Uncharacterized protein n=1 Tax=Paramuricea clavata TaxID=317549 RepID=A0A6S7JXT7_PARCT|nr:Hypothetical predicted protein [Paramuricea clavata]